MDEAVSYRDAIRGNLLELYCSDPPVKRIRGIYRTSRHNISYVASEGLWAHLKSVRELVSHSVATTRDEYDSILIGCALDCEAEMAQLGVYASFGIAQKLINLFMKDQWALGRAEEYEALLHAPLDRLVLSAIPGRRHIAPAWNAWTKARSSDPETLPGYRALQRTLSDMAAAEGISVIRMEQRIWAARRPPRA